MLRMRCNTQMASLLVGAKLLLLSTNLLFHLAPPPPTRANFTSEISMSRPAEKLWLKCLPGACIVQRRRVGVDCAFFRFLTILFRRYGQANVSLPPPLDSPAIMNCGYGYVTYADAGSAQVIFARRSFLYVRLISWG